MQDTPAGRKVFMLASGRYAMLDDRLGFRLVPCKPVIEQRLGQQVAASGCHGKMGGKRKLRCSEYCRENKSLDAT